LTKNPIYCAIDTSNIDEAISVVDEVYKYIGGIKLGLEFFTSCGINEVEKFKTYDLPLFIDLKLYDIPNTVKKSLHNILQLNPKFTTLHISGGSEMLKTCVDLKKNLKSDTNLIGVTMLTSFENDTIKEIGISDSISSNVNKLTDLAYSCGLDGIVCSPVEIKDIKHNYGDKLKIITPGIRNLDENNNDQKRTLSAKEAISEGADIIVIGRPITKAKSPAEAAKMFKNSLQ